MRRLVVTTGGTGGHIFPALAVVQALKSLQPELEIVFAGGNYGLEKDLATRAGLAFVGLPVRGFSGRGWRSVPAGLSMCFSLLRIGFYFLRFRPCVVAGFGGYAGFAPVFAACILRIPCSLHEQNSRPGLANKILGRFVDRIFLTYPEAREFFTGRRVSVCGNPVRADLIAVRNKEYKPAMQKKRLLILGGSQGARCLNDALVSALPALNKTGVSVVHQTGKDDYRQVLGAYEQSALSEADYKVTAFIDDMAKAYEEADLVICRCGASTIAELCVTGRPALLVPFALSAGNHQLHNARAMEKTGGAVVVLEEELKNPDWLQTLIELLSDSVRLGDMARIAKKTGKPQAATELAEQILELAQKYKPQTSRAKGHEA